jgi:hypothetical protein
MLYAVRTTLCCLKLPPSLLHGLSAPGALSCIGSSSLKVLAANLHVIVLAVGCPIANLPTNSNPFGHRG